MKTTETKILLVTLSLLLVAIFGWNSVLGLRAEEPRRAIVAIEMLLNSEYLVPKIHNWNYYNKPPVFNWCLLLFMKLFNSYDEWVVRLPSLCSYLITGGLLYLLAKPFTTHQIALFASLFYLTSADIFFYGCVHGGEIDLFFSLLVFVQVGTIFYFHQRQQLFLMFVVSYIVAALGTLTKGPPSIAFQAITILSWLLLNRQWKTLLHWTHYFGVVVFVSIVGGYFYLYSIENDAVGFMIRLFKEASQRTGMEHHISDTVVSSIGFPFYLVQLLAPWSVFTLFFFRRDFLKSVNGNPFLRFAFVFIVCNIPLYWFTNDHKARYLYMFFPFFCTLISFFYFNTLRSNKLKQGIEYFFLTLMVTITCGFFILLYLPQTQEIQYILPMTLAFFGIGSILSLAYNRYVANRLSLFVLFVVVVRIVFNIVYLPIAHSNSKVKDYQAHIEQVLKITKSESIHWAGPPYIFVSDASLGPLKITEVSLTSPPLIAYQIPYYITKGNRQIFEFDESLHPGQYYLMDADFYEGSPSSILYTFEDKWIKRTLILFKWD